MLLYTSICTLLRTSLLSMPRKKIVNSLYGFLQGHGRLRNADFWAGIIGGLVS